MTPRKAKELLGHFYGHAAVTVFDPLWPETMLGVAPGVRRGDVIAALRARLGPLADHPHDPDAHLLARALRSVAAQMIEGPGAEWSAELEAELNPPAGGAVGTATNVPAEPIVGDVERRFRRQARAMVAASGATSRTVAQLYALAETEGLPASVVDEFLGELVTPVQSGEPEQPVQAANRLSPRRGPDVYRSLEPARTSSGVWLVVGTVVTLAVVGASILTIIAVTSRQSGTPTPQPTAVKPAGEPALPTAQAPEQQAPAAPGHRRELPTADGPPDGRVFAKSLNDVLRDGVSAAERERVLLSGIETLRRWWPRIEPASRVAAVQSIASGVVALSQVEESRKALVAALGKTPAESAGPAALWYVSGTAGLAAVLSRESELPPGVLQACRDLLARSTGDAPSARRSGSTFDEAAVDALMAAPLWLLKSGGGADAEGGQSSSNTRNLADAWLTAVRAASGVGSSAEDSARRTDLAVLDTVERLLTSMPDASASRTVFEFCSVLLAQARFREGDPGRDRVLSWLADPRLTAGDVHLITAAVATKSAAAGVEGTMVLSAGATQAERDEMRARYAEAWSKAADAARKSVGSGGANADWYEAARAAIGQAEQATGDLEQLAAAGYLATLNQAAVLRSRGLPAAVVNKPDPPAPPSQLKMTFATAGDGEWGRRFLSESRTAAARLGRIGEFEANPFPGPIDCEVLAEAALLGTGETRNAAQKAALKRLDYPPMINAVLETLPKVKRSTNSGDFLGQFTLAGALPSVSERWMIHYRRALVERLLTLLAASNSTVAADRASAVLAESWGVVAGTPSSAVSEADGPLEAVNAASRAYLALIAQVRQQVPAPTAMIHPDALDRTRAGRLLVAHGLPQAFAANQVSAVEALAVITAAERPAASDQCRSIIAALNQERAVARSVAAQIRVTEAAAMRLWALRLGEPL